MELNDMRMMMCRDTRCQSRQLPNLSLMDLVMSCYYRRTLCFSKWLGQWKKIKNIKNTIRHLKVYVNPQNYNNMVQHVEGGGAQK